MLTCNKIEHELMIGKVGDSKWSSLPYSLSFVCV